MNTTLPAIIAEHIAAINASDLERAVATFAEDGYIGAEAEAWGTEAIRARLKKEFLDDNVTLEVREVMEHPLTKSSSRAYTDAVSDALANDQ